MKKPTLTEIGERIKAHLKRMEADPEINPKEVGLISRFYGAGARRAGAYVKVCYVSFQGHVTLTRIKAEAYLSWLDAGNKGRHWDMEKKS